MRGYRENQLIRDNALTGSVEMDYPLALDALETVKVSLVPFYDFGQGKNKNMDSAFLSSCGLAVRARWQGITAYLALAKRLAHSDSVTIGHGTLQDKGAHFSLTYDFF